MKTALLLISLLMAQAASAEVKAFGQQMIDAHTGVNKSAVELVTKLKAKPEDNPTSQALKAGGDPTAAGELGQAIGRSLRAFGINLNFAPVLDLELFGAEVDNALRERCWGREPGEVTTWAGAFLRGLVKADAKPRTPRARPRARTRTPRSRA